MKQCAACHRQLDSHIFRRIIWSNAGHTWIRGYLDHICQECQKMVMRQCKLQFPNKTNTEILSIWRSCPWLRTKENIQKRCKDPNCASYPRYGGRGIKLEITTQELKELYFRDKAYLMKEASIDRLNNDKNYTKNNCRYLERTLNKPYQEPRK